jgi:hypothetical protein
MSLFENQIKTLITTLENITDPESFDMTNWHKYRPHTQCGFAACICGHQALASTSEFFNYQERPKDSNDKFVEDSVSISNNLGDACISLTGDIELATSIYGGDEFDRRAAAGYTFVFSPLELEHPFLHNEEPSVEEAISYLRLVLTKLGGFDD